MKMIKFAAAGVLLSLSSLSFSATESFEAIPGVIAGAYSPSNSLQNGFDGLDWTNAWAVDKSYIASISGNSSAVSDGNWGIVNGASGTLSFSSAQDFNFFGLTAGKLRGSAATVTLAAFDNGVQKYTTSFSIGASASALSVNWMNIDKIEISVKNGGLKSTAVFDQLNVTAVPEPETYAMFLAGLGIMGAMARRRKQA